MSEDFFRHDWSLAAVMETRWETDVSSSRDTDAESRRQILQRPQRTQTARLVSTDFQLLTRLAMTTYRATTQAQVYPIYPDVTFTPTSSTGTTINCATANRRFFVGSKVIVIPYDGGTFGQSYVREVATINAASIDVTVAIPGTLPARSFVFPAMDIHQVLEAKLTMTTDRVGVYEAEILERASQGFKSLPASHPVSIPGFMQSYLGYPIYTFAHNWQSQPEIRLKRTGDVVPVGKDQITSTGSGKPRWELKFTHSFCDRASYFELLQFFDSRRGRLLAFWAFAPFAFFDYQAQPTTTEIDILDTFDEADLAGVSHFAVVLEDGTVHVRGLQSFSVVGNSVRLVADAALPVFAAGEVSYATLAILARLDEDFIQERWLNEEVCQTSLTVLEVVREQDIDAVNEIKYRPGIEFTACP